MSVALALLVVGMSASAAADVPPPHVQAARLIAHDGQARDRLGFAVALDGDTLAVGAPNATVGDAPGRGAVYVYVRSGSAWVLQQKLSTPGVTANGHLGFSVALSGNLLLAGAPDSEPYSHPDQGAVYVFERAGSTWTQRARIHGASGVSGDRFGWSLALSGKSVVVGAPYSEEASAPDSGVVYRYVLRHVAGGALASFELARLTEPNPAPGDHFGYSVALSGDKVLAGAPGRDGAHTDQGAAYAFTNGDEEQVLSAPFPAAGNEFGASVALGGDDAVIGAPRVDSGGSDQGAAYTYAYAAGAWVEGQTLTPPAGAQEDDARFGTAVSLDAGTLAVGAPLESNAGRDRQGTVYTFAGGAGVWTARQALANPLALHYAHLGTAVAVSGTDLAAGSPNEAIPEPGADDVSNGQGSATVFTELRAADDAYSADQGQRLNVPAPGVLANDSNPTGRTLSAQVVSGPAHGHALQLNPDGSFVYIPDPGFSGADSFRYETTLAGVSSNPATVTITVRPRPVAHPDSYSTAQDTPLNSPAATGVLANDETGSGGPLTASLSSGPTHGTVTLNPDGSFTYTPASGYNGLDAFTYATHDGILESLPATVSLTVLAPPPAATPPVAEDDYYDTPAGTPLSAPAATGVLANDTSALTATLLAGPGHGAVTLQPDGSFTYTPAAGYSGPDTFSYQAANPDGTDQGDVTLTVHPPPNHPPTAGDDTVTTTQDTSVQISAAHLLANDVDADGNPLSAASPLPLTEPAHGRLTVTAGSATYTPDTGFHGTDSFTYAVSDGLDSSPPATVTITVPPAGPPDVESGDVIVVPPPTGGAPPGPSVPVDPGEALAVCAVRLDAPAGSAHRLLVADGRVEIHSSRHVNVKTRLTRNGVRLLRGTVGGVTVQVRAICHARRGEIVGDVKAARAMLRVEQTVTPPGSWVPDRAVLTRLGERYVLALHRRLAPLPVARLRCDGHAALAPSSEVDPELLAQRRAHLVCRLLTQKSLVARPVIVGHSNTAPIASNATEAGRAANRRTEITITYRSSSRAAGASAAGDGLPARPWTPPRAHTAPSASVPRGA